jgi:hypothetical protein
MYCKYIIWLKLIIAQAYYLLQSMENKKAAGNTLVTTA